MKRSPNIRAKTIDKIAAAIAALEAPVTWNKVVLAARIETGATYTRQALSKHPILLEAYRRRKRIETSGSEGQPHSREGRAKNSAATRWRAEREAIRAAMRAYEDKFIRIIANAYNMNIRVEQLLAPIAPAQRANGKRRRRAALS